MLENKVTLTFIIGFLICCLPYALPGADDVILKILDINVWSGLDYKGIVKMGEYESPAQREKRYQALVQQLKALDPDIIGAHELNRLPHYARRLAADIGYDLFFHPGLGGLRVGCIGLPWNLREGDGLFIKKQYQAEFAGRKQLSGGYVGRWLSCHFSDATQIIAVKLLLGDSPLYLFATHWHASLDADPRAIEQLRALYVRGNYSTQAYLRVIDRIDQGLQWRLSEARQTIAFIRQTAGHNPFILMGDFNARASACEIKTLTAAGMIDVFRYIHPDSAGFTWNPQTNLNQKLYYSTDRLPPNADLLTQLQGQLINTPRRIDYIFWGPDSLILSNQVNVLKSQVVLQELVNGVHASDHYGVYAEIKMTGLD